jgi:hypothetical protein
MVLRHPRLNENAAAFRTSARATSNLAQQLKATLRGAKVRKINSSVGVDNSDKRDVREIESLRNHLRAKENVYCSARDSIENFCVRPFSTRRVEIHSGNRRRRKPIGEQTLYLLGSQSPLAKRASSALLAHLARRFLMTTVVAEKPLRRAVNGEGDAAIGTCHDRRTFAAEHERRIAASIEEQNALLATSERMLERAVQLIANHIRVRRRCWSFSRFFWPATPSKIDNVNAWEATAADALREIQ